GNGDGTFQDYRAVAGPGGNSLVAADFDGDGRLDLAVADSTLHQVTVLLNQGGGAFQACTPFPVGTTPVALAAGDFNGDGLPDLAVADRATDQVMVLLNQ